MNRDACKSDEQGDQRPCMHTFLGQPVDDRSEVGEVTT